MVDKVSKRIGVILGQQGDTCEFLGYGIYEGDFIPPEDIGGLNIGFPNPRLRLDNGDIVWGCEVWWGDENAVKKYLEEFKGNVITVSIHDARNAAKMTEIL